MVDFEENFFGDEGIKFTEDSVTWGERIFDEVLCTNLQGHGFYRRSNEQPVLPRAIGCQKPTSVDDYSTFLKEWVKWNLSMLLCCIVYYILFNSH